MANEKFSQFTSQASIATGDVIVGLHSGVNTKFNPFSFGQDLTVNNLTIGQGSFVGSNTVLGNAVLTNNVSGTNNVGLGFGSLNSLSTGSNNLGIGTFALNLISDGTNNIAIGYQAAPLLGTTNSGTYNVFIGTRTGYGGGNSASTDLNGGSYNTLIGGYAATNTTLCTGAIAIGAYSNVDAATGTTSGTYGPGIAIGSSYHPVGFRGDATAIPAGSQQYWRMKVNDTYYQIPLITDAASLLWPASGTLATTSQLPNQAVNTGSSPTFVGLTLSSAFKGVTSINDASNNPYISFTSTPTAINYFSITNANTSNYPILSADGTDINIGFGFYSKGTGPFVFLSQSTNTVFQVNSGAGYQHQTQLNFPSTNNAITISFPDATGTIALTNQLPNQAVNTNSTPTFVGLITAPAASSSSSIAISSAFQNTLGYDAIFTVTIEFSGASGTYTLLSGIGPTNTPTQQTILSYTTDTVLAIPLYIPKNYYALLSTTGTVFASIVGQQAMPV